MAGGKRFPPRRAPMRAVLAAAALVAAGLPVPAGPATAAGEVVRVPVEDPLVDRNGDGFQDVIIEHRAVHRDLDFDGLFDYTVSLAFKEYTAEGHRRYLASGRDPAVFAELTLAGIEKLCATEQLAAQWTRENFARFGYYRDGYGRLAIFDASPGNDGRLAGKAARFGYALVATFNPDGTVRTVEGGGRVVSLAAFDYATNTSSGTMVRLPGIEGARDLAAVRETLEGLLAAGMAAGTAAGP